MNKESTEVDKAENRSKALKVDGKTVPDILREMREFAEKRLAERNYMMKRECVGLIVNQFADMFEIAWKREREHVGKTDMLGNMAKMREALDEIRVAAMSDYEPDADYLIEKCNAALSAPARNCDNYATAEEALKAYQAAFDESNFENGECKLGCPGCDDFPIRCEVRWLFATAKGGAE